MKPGNHGNDHRLGGADPVPFPLSAHAILTAAPYPPGQVISANSLEAVQWETFDTNDPTIFATGDISNDVVNAPGDISLIVLQAGVVVRRVSGFWEVGAYGHYFQFDSEIAVTPDSAYVLTAPPAVGQGATAVNDAEAGQGFLLSAGNLDASDRYCHNITMQVLWVPGPGDDVSIY